QAHEARAHQVVVDGAHLVLELADVENAVVALDGAAGNAAEDGGAAGLVVVDVAGGVADQLVAGLGVGLGADLVRHGARREGRRRGRPPASPSPRRASRRSWFP